MTANAPNNVVSILRNAGRSKPATIRVESLGADLQFQKLTVAQANDYTFSMMGKDGKPDMSKVRGHKIKLVQLSIVDSDGVRQASEADLQEVDNDVLEELFAICQKLNGFGKNDPEQALFDLYKAGKLTVDELATALKDKSGAEGNG